MKSTRGLVLAIILAVVLIFLLLLFPVLRDGIQKARFMVSGLFDRSFDYQHFSDLRLENQRLKFELEQIRENSSLVKDFDYESALVYSRYPFNDQKAITINLGSEEGVAESNPVLTEEGFLFGVVSNVKNHQAEVQTIFDPSWKSAVAVGSFATEAVLQGGSPPSLDLLPRDSGVEVGDNIFNTADNYPLYQLIGTVKSIEEQESDLWNTGIVEVPYEIEDIQNLMVITDFP